MLLALVAGLAMFVGDVFQALYVVLLDHDHPTWAGVCDGADDATTVGSIGGGTAAVFVHHDVPIAVLTIALIWLGSIAGAVLRERISRRWCKSPADQLPPL